MSKKGEKCLFLEKFRDKKVRGDQRNFCKKSKRGPKEFLCKKVFVF
jgi:hypothetical protein